MPFNPVSFRIYSPVLFNPAIAGSKDYLSVDLQAGFQGKSYSQALSGNTRIVKKIGGYRELGNTYSFTNFGISFSGFNEFREADSTHNAGLTAGMSYHIPLGKKALSFLSFGASVKGMYHFYEGNQDLNIPHKEFYSPNVDLGVYLYTPDLYAGLSATNILAQPKDTSSIGTYSVPISRQYNFMAGYKILISRSLNIILEPSLIIHTDDSLSFDINENVEPLIKLYISNFCIGTYFNDYSKVSFFFQYKYPRFYVGTFFALHKDSPYYKTPLTAEIAFGFNFSRNKSGYTNNGRW
jgi:type IX secretion system PorP/SprF family membrane protein